MKRKFVRFENSIFDINSVELSDEEKEYILSTSMSSNKITDLLLVSDIGRNDNGYVYMFTDQAHKTEFLNLCSELLYKSDTGYTLFAIKKEGEWNVVI